MDISIFSCLAAIFLPIVYAIYLLIARIRLSYVNKTILNLASIIINIISLTFFTFQTSLITFDNSIFNISLPAFNFNNISLDFGITINQNNIYFLVFSSFTFAILSLYAKFYFDKKKQFLFTKQRFYIFLSTLSFNTYMLFSSLNLFQFITFLILEGLIIYIFSYFDIFKSNANFNTSRFQRITTIGDFSLLISILILFKYAVLSEGYINSTALNFNELNIITSYTYGISNPFEFKIAALGFIIAFMSRLFIFPLNCYSSFLANSSNILYLSSITIANALVGIYIFFKTLPFVELSDKLQDYLIILFILSSLMSLIFIFFEKNFKIIFGNLISIINCAFCSFYLITKKEELFFIYLGLNFIILFILMILFMKDKNGLNKALISKHKGFILEKIHIVLFEVFPHKISNLVDLTDKKIIQNILLAPIKIIDTIISLFTIKIKRKDRIKNIRNILIIFAIFTLLAIFIALFGRYKC